MLHHATRRPAALLAGLALVGVVALGACAADDGDDAEPGPDASLIPPESAQAETTTGSSTSTATEPTTTATTTTASTPTAFAPSAREAIDGLKTAWEAGDQAGARALAPGEVVDQLFAVPADGFETYGCDTGEFETSTCNFRNRSTEAFIVVTAARTDAGWQIASVDVNAD
ncbi:hypothetical protein HC251_13510 [Iamia sp. SCSIO 61187]|uniref:hypothetical protein n=1 Tax=Iamia sp. SCSIO 61187 TaxID=2722752 RepID=UPI001C62F687|nr:hypothetical protein [Iamia sp. SCSIO 61187]QYG93341.1 hypothetical protein HC251_13510 [Iamia sp. SCSIO 61187]